MYDGGKVILGIIAFVLLFTSPVWYNMATGRAVEPPELVLPEKAEKCIEPAEYMRTNHMQLLNRWRDSVVRRNNRIYVATDGQEYLMSLTETCLDCHAGRRNFCLKCHDYEAVTPTCWDCHIVPEELEQ